jgi:hypothetical protein
MMLPGMFGSKSGSEAGDGSIRRDGLADPPGTPKAGACWKSPTQFALISSSTHRLRGHHTPPSNKVLVFLQACFDFY